MQMHHQEIVNALQNGRFPHAQRLEHVMYFAGH